MSELKITQEKVTAAFSEANDCPKAISILTALFGKQKPDYTDYHNIKTYEDACEAIGVKPIVRLLVEDEDFRICESQVPSSRMRTLLCSYTGMSIITKTMLITKAKPR